MRKILFFFLYSVIFILTFAAGFFLTDLIFRAKKIPYPSEWFGVAAGLGLASAVQALIRLFLALRFHLKASKGAGPQVVSEKDKARWAEILK